MTCHQLVCQVQPDAQSAQRRVEGTGALKALEEVWKVGWRNANSPILHPEQRLLWARRCPAQSHLDLASGRAILDGVPDQIAQDLRDTPLVKPARQALCVLFSLQNSERADQGIVPGKSSPPLHLPGIVGLWVGVKG